jgi:hypothetical protein
MIPIKHPANAAARFRFDNAPGIGIGLPSIMKLSRRPRLVAAIIALVSMLYVQLAVAAYACPGLNPELAVAAQAAQGAAMDMADCAGMDAEQPSLCFAAGQTGKQSLDKPAAPAVPPFVPAQSAVQLVWGATPAGHAPLAPPSALPLRASAPPLAIRHCCFRL